MEPTRASRKALILVASFAVIVVILGSLLVYVYMTNQSEISSLNSQLNSKEETISNYAAQVSTETANINSLNSTLIRLKANNTALQNEISSLEQSSGKPTLVIWIVAQSISSGHFLVEAFLILLTTTIVSLRALK